MVERANLKMVVRLDSPQVVPLDDPHGIVVAWGVSEADFMAQYADQRCEYIEGMVIKIAPVTEKHDEFSAYLQALMDTYFALKPFGKVRSAPFAMRFTTLRHAQGGQWNYVRIIREPDLMVIVAERFVFLTSTLMDGAANICIEIASPESTERDYEEKRLEYEHGGVGEYWLFDPQSQQAYFYQRDGQGRFILASLDENGNYRTALLPKFALNMPTLWQDSLPNVLQIADSVRAMLAE